jgi:hypothetical protein
MLILVLVHMILLQANTAAGDGRRVAGNMRPSLFVRLLVLEEEPRPSQPADNHFSLTGHNLNMACRYARVPNRSCVSLQQDEGLDQVRGSIVHCF